MASDVIHTHNAVLVLTYLPVLPVAVAVSDTILLTERLVAVAAAALLVDADASMNL
jgi:hypothetical protein